jgi:hypothetical protein
MVFLSTSRKIWENIEADLPTSKFGDHPLFTYPCQCKNNPLRSSTNNIVEKVYIVGPKQSGRVGQNCEAENKL